MIKRRVLLFAIGACALALPLASIAQAPGKMPRIGYLVIADRPAYKAAFQQGLRELGYFEGRNITVEYRFAASKEERLPALAAELIALNVDVLVAPDPPSYRAALKVSRTIPLVIRASNDPVAEGAAASLAHPGGNATGVFSLYSELTAKRLELLKETVPSISRVMVLYDPAYADELAAGGPATAAAKKLGLKLLPTAARSAEEIGAAFNGAAKEHVNALLVLRAPLMVNNSSLIAQLAAKKKLPAVFDDPPYTLAGGLMSYGANLPEMYRQTATFVDKILKGAKPGDLPIEQPTRLELVVNVKAARALGIKIPQSVLLRAERVLK